MFRSVYFKIRNQHLSLVLKLPLEKELLLLDSQVVSRFWFCLSCVGLSFLRSLRTLVLVELDRPRLWPRHRFAFQLALLLVLARRLPLQARATGKSGDESTNAAAPCKLAAVHLPKSLQQGLPWRHRDVPTTLTS